MTYPATAVQLNNDRGPDTYTASFWPGAVGSDIAAATLVRQGCPPRRLYAGHTGNLVLVHADGNGSSYSDTMVVVAGQIYFINTIIGVTASGSSAYNLTFGW
jgi:hypothetical protein